MNYTKGEWKKEGNKVKVFGRGIIAICPSPTDDYGVLEFVANAHLIAAAPEMYKALKRFEQIALHSGQFTPPDLLIACGNALAKAGRR